MCDAFVQMCGWMCADVCMVCADVWMGVCRCVHGCVQMCAWVCADVYTAFVCMDVYVRAACSFDKLNMASLDAPHLLIKVRLENDPRLWDENEDKLHEVGDKLETEGGETKHIPHSMLGGLGKGGRKESSHQGKDR